MQENNRKANCISFTFKQPISSLIRCIVRTKLQLTLFAMLLTRQACISHSLNSLGSYFSFVEKYKAKASVLHAIHVNHRVIYKPIPS